MNKDVSMLRNPWYDDICKSSRFSASSSSSSKNETSFILRVVAATCRYEFSPVTKTESVGDAIGKIPSHPVAQKMVGHCEGPLNFVQSQWKRFLDKNGVTYNNTSFQISKFPRVISVSFQKAQFSYRRVDILVFKVLFPEYGSEGYNMIAPN